MQIETKDQNIMVAIVLPVFNTSAYLKDCIESLFRQTYGDIVIYAVDDGSTDNSLSILREYQKLDPMAEFLLREMRP